MHLVCDFYVVVCTLYGHSFTFEPGVPVRVPEWMVYEVMAHGPRPVDGSIKPHEMPDGPPPDPDPEDMTGPEQMERAAEEAPAELDVEETSKPKKRK